LAIKERLRRREIAMNFIGQRKRVSSRLGDCRDLVSKCAPLAWGSTRDDRDCNVAAPWGVKARNRNAVCDEVTVPFHELTMTLRGPLYNRSVIR
jgi:hypothetical protein